MKLVYLFGKLIGYILLLPLLPLILFAKIFLPTEPDYYGWWEYKHRK